MIERYALYDIDKLRDQFDIAHGVPKGVKIRYNYVPAQQVPVVRRDGDQLVMQHMQWGFVPQNAKDTNSIFRYKTFTARSEDIFKKNMWEKSIRSQRCIIPANGFYVWVKKDGTSTPYFVHSQDGSVFAMAGVYSSWRDVDGTEMSMTAIVTVPSGSAAQAITERMPAIVHPEQLAAWLDPSMTDIATLYDVMRTPRSDLFSFTRVGDGIYSKKIDSPELIREV